MTSPDEAAYRAALPQRMAEVEATINRAAEAILPEGFRFEWTDAAGFLSDALAGTLPPDLEAEIEAHTYRYPVYPGPYLHPPRHERAELPEACYRADAGFMVHVTPGCRCAR